MWGITYFDLPQQSEGIYFISKDEAYKDQCVFLFDLIRDNISMFCEDEEDKKYFKSLGKEMQDLCNQSKYIEAIDLYIDCTGDQFFSITEVEPKKARGIPIIDWEAL